MTMWRPCDPVTLSETGGALGQMCEKMTVDASGGLLEPANKYPVPDGSSGAYGRDSEAKPISRKHGALNM